MVLFLDFKFMQKMGLAGDISYDDHNQTTNNQNENITNNKLVNNISNETKNQINTAYEKVFNIATTVKNQMNRVNDVTATSGSNQSNNATFNFSGLDGGNFTVEQVNKAKADVALVATIQAIMDLKESNEVKAICADMLGVTNASGNANDNSNAAATTNNNANTNQQGATTSKFIARESFQQYSNLPSFSYANALSCPTESFIPPVSLLTGIIDEEMNRYDKDKEHYDCPCKLTNNVNSKLNILQNKDLADVYSKSSESYRYIGGKFKDNFQLPCIVGCANKEQSDKTVLNPIRRKNAFLGFSNSTEHFKLPCVIGCADITKTNQIINNINKNYTSNEEWNNTTNKTENISNYMNKVSQNLNKVSENIKNLQNNIQAVSNIDQSNNLTVEAVGAKNIDAVIKQSNEFANKVSVAYEDFMKDIQETADKIESESKTETKHDNSSTNKNTNSNTASTENTNTNDNKQDSKIDKISGSVKIIIIIAVIVVVLALAGGLAYYFLVVRPKQLPTKGKPKPKKPEQKKPEQEELLKNGEPNNLNNEEPKKGAFINLENKSGTEIF